jgi:hypothetical protein
MVVQQRRKIRGSGSGYKLWFTWIIGHPGKSREARTLKRSIPMEIPHIEERDFSPLLVQVGKANSPCADDIARAI